MNRLKVMLIVAVVLVNGSRGVVSSFSDHRGLLGPMARCSSELTALAGGQRF
jgi:hypothetical protein